MTQRWMTETKHWKGNSIMPTNTYCWAVGRMLKSGARKVRRIVWGRALARIERREGEEIWRAMIVTRANLR